RPAIAAARAEPAALPARAAAPPPVRVAEPAVVPVGSLLGASRPMLAPPVPFSAANAAGLGAAR
uniref:hypothetical protein n=1 Tax=Crenalkalicoccus roseus TaxID=1485588 RepID=UPI0038CF8755